MSIKMGNEIKFLNEQIAHLSQRILNLEINLKKLESEKSFKRKLIDKNNAELENVKND